MNDVPLSALLADYARTRDADLIARLVEGYLPLSNALARKFAGRGIELEDLEQVAAMGLMKAIERFDPERGFQFSTFAVPTIVGDLRRQIRDHASTIRLTRNIREDLGRLQHAQDQLTQELRREPSLREIAEAMNVTDDHLLLMLDARDRAETVSLNAGTSDKPALESFFSVPETGYERVEQRQWMDWVLSLVTPLERQLLELRYRERMSQRDVARALGITQMRVSRMEQRVLARLRKQAEPWHDAMAHD